MDKRKLKDLWRGVFSLNRQVMTMYAHAYTERQAWMIFCRRLASKHSINIHNVMNYFDKKNYEINKEVEFEEEP
jgi:hypothetical protein